MSSRIPVPVQFYRNTYILCVAHLYYARLAAIFDGCWAIWSWSWPQLLVSVHEWMKNGSIGTNCHLTTGDTLTLEEKTIS